MKKFLKIAALVVVVLLLALISVPFLFKGKIIAKVKSTINEQVNAEVNFGEFDLSIIKHFPKLTFTLNDLSVVGKDQFKGDTLVAMKQFEVALNLMSVLNGDYTIQSLYLRTPRIHAIVLENGKANWDIMKPGDSTKTGTSEESKPFKMKLSHYGISDGFVEYTDKQGKMYALINQLNHEGSGDFTSDLFNFDTKTTIEQLTYTYEGITYLKKVKTIYNAVIAIDNKASKYTFKENDLVLNALHLSFNGWLAMPKDDIDMDITFKTPSTDFKTLFSLVPGAYTKDYENVKSSGTMAFDGFVKGTYNDTKMPAWKVTVLAKNGKVQYPSLPQAIQNINMDLTASCADGNMDNMLIAIKNGHFEMGSAPFDFNLVFAQPMTAMNIDMKAKGKLNLAEVNKMFPMEGVTTLDGLLNADISAKGSIAAAQAKKFDQFYADGLIELSNMHYASKDFDKGVSINTMRMLFNPKDVKLETFTGKVSKMNIEANGSLDNVLAYVLNNQTIGGKLVVQIDELNVDEWMTPTATPDPKAGAAPAAKSEVFKVPANIRFDMLAKIGKLHYDKINMTAVSGGVQIADEKMTLQDLQANLMQGSMRVSGSYATKNVKLPDIDLSYDIKDWDIKSSFDAFNTVKKIAPIAEYMKGKFSTTLSMVGKMNADMSPELNSITGKGYFTIFNGSIANFKPIQKIAEVLQISSIGEYQVPDLKTWFSINNGRITVEPFTIKSKDMIMGINGSQGLDQSIDYTIHMDIPRSKMGSAANAMIDKAVGLANSKGANFKADERIKFDVLLGGTLTNPAVKTGLKDALKNKADDLKDMAKAELEKKKKEAEDKAKAEIEKQKKEAEDKAKAEIEKQKKAAADKANAEADKAKKEAEAKAKAAADKLKADADAKAKAEAEKLKKKGKDAINNLFKK